MKKLLIYTSIFLAVGQVGCTDGFQELNTNPNASSPSNFNISYFIPSSQRNHMSSMSGYSGALLFQAGWAQILASTTSGAANYYSNADKYVQSTNTTSYQASSWNNSYTGAARAQEVIKVLGNDPERVNLVSAAKIMRVLNLSYISDIYGDIPYSEALQGEEGIRLPKYDRQEVAYAGMLAELEGALLAFDASKPGIGADASNYAGNIEKWKRFGYSLMLKMAMRMTKVNESLAKTWAEKAIAGGTMASVDDDYVLDGDPATGYSNSNATSLITPADYYQTKWSKTFIDFLDANDDPRISLIAELPPAGLAGANDVTANGNNSAALQQGLPNGWDLNGGATDISNAPGYPGASGTGSDADIIGRYSRPRRAVYMDQASPVIVMSYAETQLLKAEAAVRSWNVGGTAADFYRTGLSAGIQSLRHFGAASTIAAGTADAYAAAHPLDISSTTNSLKMINEQYWATTGALFNYVESWNNWKRSGYPVLAPVTYTGNFSQNQIPRRQPYPTTEGSNNTAAYQEAIGNIQGGDTWIGRVWWDVN